MLNLNRIEEVIEDLLAENFAQKISFPASELADAAIAELSVKDQDEIKRIRKECEKTDSALKKQDKIEEAAEKYKI